MGIRIDWGRLALERGYDTPRQMLEDLYITKGLPLQSVADKLIVSATAVRHAMLAMGIKLRPRHQILKGPSCPKCTIQNSRVIASHPFGSYMIRYRICLSCGARFKTKEVVVCERGSTQGHEFRSESTVDGQ